MAGFEETSVGFKSIFQKTFNDTESLGDRLATRIKSNALSEHYVWLGNFPNMKEWIGERELKKLEDFGYSLKNKLYEATVEVPNIHLEYDKVGLYAPAIQQMAINAKEFGGDLVGQILLNATDSEKGKCYDGKPFYSDAHEVGTDTVSNVGSGVLNDVNLLAAHAFMLSIKGENGSPLKIRPNLIVAGPKNLANIVNALNKDTKAGGESNPTYKMFDYLILPEITDMQWHLLDTTKPLKPFILQVAKDGVFESSNDDKFMKDKALFGTKSFMNAGYGLWQLAYRSTGV